MNTRRLGAVGVVALAALALVVAGPARQASALVAPPPPLAFAPGWIAAAGGSTTGVAGAGSAAAASGALGAAPAVTAGSVVIGGLTLGLMVGEAGLRLYNLTQAQQDQIKPLSEIVIDKFTPTNRGTAPAVTTPGAGGLTGWSPGSVRTFDRASVFGTPYSGTERVGPRVLTTFSVDEAPNYGGDGRVRFSWVAPDMPRYDGRVQSAGSTATGGPGWQTWGVFAIGTNVNRPADGPGQQIMNIYPDTFNYYGNPNGISPSDPPGAVNPPGGTWTSTLAVGSKLQRVDVMERDPGSSTWRVVGTWYPPGAPEREPDLTPLPTPSVLETRSTCSGQVVTARSAQFDRSGDWPAPPANPCGGGVLPSLVEVWEVVPATGASTRLTTWTAPSVADPNLNPKPGARLDLARANPDGQWISCFSVPGPCAQWYDDPAKTSNYRCTYGGAVVPLSECNVYRPSFDTSARTPYAAPDGSVPPPSPSNPSGEPKTPTQADPAPPGTVTDLGTLLATRAPIPELMSVADALGDLRPQGTTCLTIPVKVPEALGGTTLTAFDSCGTDKATTWLREHRDLTGLVVWVAMLAPLGWWAWRTYAPGSTGVA